MRTKAKPDIFRYTNYRKFLQDCFIFKKSRNKGFTYRYFTQAAGYTSSGILKEVIDGRRKLPIKRIRDFIAPFGLTDKENRFFEILVNYNEAKHELDKSRYFREMIQLRRKPRTRVLTGKEASFYDKWYHSVLREIITLRGFVDDPKVLAKRISPAISAAQAKKSIDLLKKLGFIKKEKGKYIQAEPKLDVDPDEYIQSVKEFTRSMIELGWESIERFDPADREVSGLTLGMSRATYKKVKEKIRRTQEEIFDFVCNDPTGSEIVCRLNVELFPLVSEMERNKNKN